MPWIKFQSVLVPNGYIACLHGPVPAKTHDAKLLCQSNLMEQLHMAMPDDNLNGPIYSLYGDLAYPNLHTYLVVFAMLSMGEMKLISTDLCHLFKSQLNGVIVKSQNNGNSWISVKQ